MPFSVIYVCELFVVVRRKSNVFVVKNPEIIGAPGFFYCYIINFAFMRFKVQQPMADISKIRHRLRLFSDIPNKTHLNQ